MFTLEQIHEAHSRVTSGADFPQFLQDLIELGVTGNSIFVADGHAEYWDKDGERLVSDAAYPSTEIADACDVDEFKARLKLHQQGGTDYPKFCSDCAETGVDHWTIDMAAMTCTYFDKAGNAVLVEQIPTP
ncbi:MAG TPA: DUF1398 family protein [Pyrinomonadaceae bacterium]|nr:DUF1398 family protein [Acidobacteriota bacterium]HQZ95468.1 DUF1398 family protein [Pyrinomonadaceae bacterium]